jgi:hypothetical protein
MKMVTKYRYHSVKKRFKLMAAIKDLRLSYKDFAYVIGVNHRDFWKYLEGYLGEVKSNNIKTAVDKYFTDYSLESPAD